MLKDTEYLQVKDYDKFEFDQQAVIPDSQTERKLVKDFLTVEQAKEYQQLVKILAAKNYTL